MNAPANSPADPARKAGTRPNWVAPALIALTLLVILALAAWLRWEYIQRVSLHVDEFTTLWAAKQVQAHGAPVMPSGVLYTRGLLASYVEAAFLTLFGYSYTIGRLPALFFGLATVAALVWVGRRGWRWWVGLLAALGLALLPEAIIWGGRARFYAQLQFFTLLTLWAAWEAIGDSGAQSGNRRTWGRPLLYALLFVLALFSQEQTALLFPSILLAMLLWRGWRWLLTGPVLVANLIIVAALMTRILIEIGGQPGYFETIQATRPYLGWIFDVRGALTAYAPLFVAPDRLPWTLAGLTALAAALWVALRARSLRNIDRFHQSTLFYALNLGSVMTILFLLVGTSWREARYLYFVQPLWLLLGAAGIVYLVERVIPRRGQGWVLAAVAALVLVWMLPAAMRTPQQQVEGYDRVLAVVHEQLQPGDAVLSPQPPACALVLGRPCDAYAIQRGYEEFVIERDNVLVDRWSGAPLLNSTMQLSQTIDSAARTWFVSDAFRLATRYDADFLKTLITQFEPAIAEQGVLALRAEGLRAPPELTATQTLTPPVRFGPLALTAWAHGDSNPGRPFDVELTWTGAEKVDEQINTSVRLVNTEGVTVAQQDGPPARGIIPTTLFFDTPLPDPKRLALPADLPSGRYRVDVAAYAVDSAGETAPQGDVYPIDWFFLGTPQTPLTPRVGAWQNGIVLLGATNAPQQIVAGSTLAVTIEWWAEAPLTQTLTAFVHLIGPDGNVLAQDDHAPEHGFYPTNRWDLREPVTDAYSLRIPETLPPGNYRLVTGWYDRATGARVAVVDRSDAIVLASWEQ